MIIRSATDEEISNFCQELTFKRTENFRAISCFHDGKCLGTVGYDDWTENAVTMHICIWDKRALWFKDFFVEAFRFPFEIGKKGLVIGLIPSYNQTALELSRYLGFREGYRIRDGWALGTDLVIQEMRREECRFLEVNNGRQVNPGSS